MTLPVIRVGFNSDSELNSFLISCRFISFVEMSRFFKKTSYREAELFVEDGLQSFSEHFGLAGFGLVGQDVDFDVRIRAFVQVHALQAVGLFYSHHELEDTQTGFSSKRLLWHKETT